MAVVEREDVEFRMEKRGVCCFLLPSIISLLVIYWPAFYYFWAGRKPKSWPAKNYEPQIQLSSTPMHVLMA
jgi:hypothetical protein